MAVNDSLIDPDDRRTDLPTFDLSYTVDDDDDPEWITIYAEGEAAFATNWISIDAASAVDLAHVA